MKKLFLISLLSTLALQSSYVTASPVTVQAPAVTVTAGSDQGSGAAPSSGSVLSKMKSRRGRRSSKGSAAPAAAAASSSGPGPVGSGPVSNAASSSDSSSSNSNDSSSSGPTSGGLVTKAEFLNAFNAAKPFFSDPNVPEPTDDQFNAFISNASKAGGITSRTELAMFLSEIIWESGGLVYRAEVACKDTNCPSEYKDDVGLPGKYYFGRGYIQLTWGANYKKASEGLYGDDRLLQNPDQVATNEDYAWGVSFWFWKNIVKPKLNGTYNFGSATNAINGALECQGANQDIAHKRYKIYVQVLKVFEPSATPVETGCYN